MKFPSTYLNINKMILPLNQYLEERRLSSDVAWPGVGGQ